MYTGGAKTAVAAKTVAGAAVAMEGTPKRPAVYAGCIIILSLYIYIYMHIHAYLYLYISLSLYIYI